LAAHDRIGDPSFDLGSEQRTGLVRSAALVRHDVGSLGLEYKHHLAAVVQSAHHWCLLALRNARHLATHINQKLAQGHHAIPKQIRLTSKALDKKIGKKIMRSLSLSIKAFWSASPAVRDDKTCWQKLPAAAGQVR
jgi:hypothetical protein